MNVLLVDDDRFVIAALEKKINWSALNISEVYTACNVKQAQNILTQHNMPRKQSPYLLWIIC